MIIEELNRLQAEHGFLSKEGLQEIARRLKVPLYRVAEVASYYPLYRHAPPAAVEVKVCRDMACHLHGASRLRQTLADGARTLGEACVTVEGVSCLGQCDRPVAVAINDHVYRGLSDSAHLQHIQTVAAGGRLPQQHADRSPPAWKIDPYQGRPHYDALRNFLNDGDADRVLREIDTSGLRGMGGAGFPTARKWAAVRSAPGDTKYVICNADESEPGTFKDRELLRRTPWLLIEGMVIAGLVTGARRGWIYIRHEYHEELEVLRDALRETQGQGIWGDNIRGSGLSFSLDIFVSPGGYIQGEETALLEAMEDRRGEPRNKPPFPVTHGLQGQPTVINNVETLCWVPAILRHGGAWYRDQGVHGATGLRLVSICGDVQRPGVYEVPLGQTVRDLVFTMAGGLSPGRQLKAIATSGPSGGFLPARIDVRQLPAKFIEQKLPAGAESYDTLDLTLDFQTLALLGGMLGAAFVVYDNTRDMFEQALNCTEFFRNESCGKCVPCRLGTQRLVEMIAESRQSRTPLPVTKVQEVTEAMALTSICGLGQVAGNPVGSVLRYFPDCCTRTGG